MNVEKHLAIIMENRSRVLGRLFIVSVLFWLVGCASNQTQTTDSEPYSTSVLPFTGDDTLHKKIFIFLDGTANDASSETNVWKLYQRVISTNDQQTTAIYISGVGTAESAPISEAALGRGMELRILEGYSFLVKNYSPGDDIILFGFSRGAHQARSLAGLVSYAGIIRNNDDEADKFENANRVIELVKKQRDVDYESKWQKWSRKDAPIMASKIKEKLNLEVLPAIVRFLGVWDTVPGSSLKNYGICKEDIGFVKGGLSVFIPGVDRGERYKTDSYPSIQHIAHAVSLDEKRSKFAPLLVCEPIVSELTTVNETWFPGAHADVGGGYKDSNELPQLSLSWMIDELSEYYLLASEQNQALNPSGLAHWSIGDSPANYLSKCEDRVPPEIADIHPSVNARRDASPVPIRWKGNLRYMPYPVDCTQQE
ncbi:MAG: DUF2235 domain-containing protein [Candidatus Thiodiazotropha sp.]